MMPYTHSRIVATMTMVLVVRFFCIGFVNFLAGLISCPASDSTLLGLFRYQAGHGASRDLEFDVVRLHAKNQGIVVSDRYDRAHNAAGGDDDVAVLQLREHLLGLLLLPLHGQEQKEVEDGEDQ